MTEFWVMSYGGWMSQQRDVTELVGLIIFQSQMCVLSNTQVIQCMVQQRRQIDLKFALDGILNNYIPSKKNESWVPCDKSAGFHVIRALDLAFM